MKRFLSHLSPGDYFLFEGKLFIKSSSITDQKFTYYEDDVHYFGNYWPDFLTVKMSEHYACLNILTGELLSFKCNEVVTGVAVDLTIHQGK